MEPLYRRFLAFFLPISGAVLALALLLYSEHVATKRRVDEIAGHSAVELHAAILEQEFRAAKSDLLFLSGQSVLQDFLSRPGSAAKEALIRDYLLLLARKDFYDGVRLFDASGREEAGAGDGGGETSSQRGLRRELGVPHFREALALARGRVYSAAFVFATPVFDGKGRRRGLLVLDYSEKRLLRRLEAAANRPGSLVLLDGDGVWLNAPPPGSARPGMQGGERRFALEYPEAWREISRGDQDLVSNREGLFAFKLFDPARVGFETDGRANSLLRIVFVMSSSRLFIQTHRVQKILTVLCVFIEGVLAVLIWFLCRARAAREFQQRRLEDSEARLRVLSAGLIETQERERKILSRDLHDDLGQLLTAACLELERALRPDGRADRLDVIQRALESTRLALDRMRDISTRLRPRVLDEIGLKEAVRSLLDDYREKTGIDVSEALSFESAEIPDDVGVNLYRILQEALTNAAKHARTNRVQVSLGLSQGDVALSVKDWGVGLDARPARPGSLGFLSMRERAELLGGTFRVESQSGQGTEVRVTIPLSAPKSERSHR